MREDLRRLPRTAREMTLDTLRNVNSRMDILMRRGAPAEASPPSLWLDRLTRGPLEAERRGLSQRAHCDLSSPAYSAVLAEVDGRAVSLPDLLALPSLRQFTDLGRTVERLIALKLLNVLRKPYIRPGAPTPGRPMLLSRLNALVIEERVEAAGALPIASPVAGTQLLLPLEDRLALLAMLGGDLGEAWANVKARGHRLKHGGRPIASAAELKDAAIARAEAVGDQMRAQLVGLGVLE
jgi:hypothetical protein